MVEIKNNKKTSEEIVWVFGLSAVGKKTLINQSQNLNLTPNKYLDVLNIKSCEKIIIPIIIPSNFKQTRKDFFCEIFKSKFPNSLILIHGQWVDIQWNILSYLKERYPNKFNKCLLIKKNEGLCKAEKSMLKSLERVFFKVEIIKSFIE